MAVVKIGNMSDFVRKCKARQLAVAKKSVERVNRECNRSQAQGGRMPVVTSTLRGSQVSALNGQLLGSNTAQDETLAALLVVASMKVGDKIQFGWTIEYARRVNSGFVGQDSLGRTFNQSGAFYLEFGIDQWKTIVSEECVNIRNALK